MKQIILTIVATFLTSILIAQTGQIKLIIKNIQRENKSKLYIAGFKKDGFLQADRAVFSKEIVVDAEELSTAFENIPVGEYAISVFQDKNNDGIFNKSLLGFPIEPSGFSQNKTGRFGPPDFEDVSFIVEEGRDTLLTINLVLNKF